MSARWASGDARASLGRSMWEGLVYRGTALAIQRERDMLGKSTLCPLAGGSGSINMPPIPPPSLLCWGKVTGSSLHKPDEVETKSGPRLYVRDLKAGAEEERAALVRAFCPFPALPLIPQSAGHVKVRIRGIPSLQGFQLHVAKLARTWPKRFETHGCVFGSSNLVQSHLKLKRKGMWRLAPVQDTTSLSPHLLVGKVGISPLPQVKQQGTVRPAGNCWPWA